MEEVPVTNVEEWKPRTKVGQLVKEGKITSVKELFARNLTIAEPEIIDVLLPNLKYEVVDIRMVQKQTDAGELSRYKVLVVMGNQDGYVGIGVGKAKQLRVAIQKSIRDAKMHIIPVRRGCGSWECTCGESHSLSVHGVRQGWKLGDNPETCTQGYRSGGRGRREDSLNLRWVEGRLVVQQRRD
jgi:SSU ribosomal protein S5P